MQSTNIWEIPSGLECVNKRVARVVWEDSAVKLATLCWGRDGVGRFVDVKDPRNLVTLLDGEEGFRLRGASTPMDDVSPFSPRHALAWRCNCVRRKRFHDGGATFSHPPL